MRKNMGIADRLIRSVLALVVVALYFSGHITGTAAIVLGVIAAMFLLTSFIGWCPAYGPLGLSTCKKGAQADSRKAI